MVGIGEKTQIQTTHIPSGTFPVIHSLLVHGLGIWRGAVFFSDHRGHLVYYSIDLLKAINVPPGIPYDLPGETGSQREVGAQLCVFRWYAELYKDRMLNKYLSKIWENI